MDNQFINECKATLDCAEFIKRAEITHKVTLPLVAPVLPCGNCFLLLLSLNIHIRTESNQTEREAQKAMKAVDCDLRIFLHISTQRNSTLILKLHTDKVAKVQFLGYNMDAAACFMFPGRALICFISTLCSVHSLTNTFCTCI